MSLNGSLIEGYGYDANGELQTRTYSYDALGNLISAQLPGKTIGYLMDGHNRWIGRKRA